MRVNLIFIILIAGFLSSCVSREKGISLFSVSEEEKEIIADAEFIDGIKEKNNGNLEKAVSHFNEVIKDSQHPAPAYFELAKIYDATENYEEAILAINKAVELNPRNKWYLEFQIELTKKLGLFNQATAAYKLRYKQFPENTDYDIEFSDFYIQTKQYSKALVLYNRIEKKIGVREDLNKNKYLIYYRSEQLDKAEEELNKLISTFPANMKFYIYLADMKIEANEVDEAFKIYDQALSIKPNDPYILAELAHQYYLKSNSEKSFELYEKVIADKSYRTKDKVDLLRRFSRIGELDQKVYDQNAKYMRLAANSEPYSPSINTLAADYFFKDQKYSEAKKYYEAILDIKSSSFVIWSQLIMCDYNNKDFKNMNLNCIKAIEYFPTQPELYLYTGLSHSQLKEYEKAIEKFEEGIELVVNNPQLTNQFQSNLGDAYHAIGNHKKSDEYFELTIAGDPGNFYVLNNYAYYLSERNTNLEKAKNMSLKSIELKPNESSFEDTYGWILFQLKDYENALIWTKKSIANGGSSSGIINEHLGDIYFHLNQPEKALEYWKKASLLEGTTDKLQEKIKLKKHL